MDVNNDFEYIKRFTDGDESAFNEIVRRYQQKIYWHARRMLGNHLDADEVTQEVLIVIYNKLRTFNYNSSLYTWIFRITSNRSKNMLKRKTLRKFLVPGDEEYEKLRSDEDIIENLSIREQFKQLESVLGRLPAKQKEVFILRNFEELSYEEISDITGKSVGGLKANYFHALKKVTEMMKNE
jgi:RNA polymerase sigma-70 factor (ECF subfamily)